MKRYLPLVPSVTLAAVLAATLAVVLAVAAASCGRSEGPSPGSPVTLTLWHTYVEDMRDYFDELVSEFNATAGAEHGVTIKVTSITDAQVINERLIAAANKDPGAPELPDMVVVYPQVAGELARKGVLLDLERYFTVDELDTFVPQFVEEGRLGGGPLYLMPITKSSEVLYVNRTFFDRFSAATGVGIDMLSTFEGIAEAAMLYYEWTDALTPDIPGDGKAFFYPEALFNQAMVGFQQLGADIAGEGALNLPQPVFQRIWDCYYAPAVMGGVAVYNGWGNYLAVTGEIVCATASSAGSTFYPSRVTYPDNTKEDVEFDVLPFPVFEGGENVVFQRGGGVCVTLSEPAREYGACLFLKWFTEAERNLRFCVNVGYMPVRKSSFADILAGDYPAVGNPVAEKALLATADMQARYRFYVPPVFEGFGALQSQYNERLRQAAQDGRDDYLRLLDTMEPAEAYAEATQGALEGFLSRF
ncbi:MAG: extracellular solute-binding protein [Clostridiales bacterium]|nr:extracellular solute-binding protein [Clostridiales bacterium]